MDQYIKILAQHGNDGASTASRLGPGRSSPDACLPTCSYSDFSKDCLNHSYWAQLRLDTGTRAGSELHGLV